MTSGFHYIEEDLQEWWLDSTFVDLGDYLANHAAFGSFLEEHHDD